MRPRFQADENLNAKIVTGLLRREPSLDIQSAKNAGILGLDDVEVLTVAAREGRILVTHDRGTVPDHFATFVGESTSAGVLIVSQKLGLQEVIEDVVLIWAASESEEWMNRIAYLPL